jgi:hypothetical protein
MGIGDADVLDTYLAMQVGRWRPEPDVLDTYLVMRREVEARTLRSYTRAWAWLFILLDFPCAWQDPQGACYYLKVKIS